MAKQKLSQRAYAKQLNVSHTAVQRAIKEHKIVRGLSGDGKIYPDIANEEWGDTARVQIGKMTDISDTGSSPKKITAASSPTEIRKHKEFLQAQLLTLKLLQEKGKLVEKEKIDNELMAFGQEIRQAFEQLADRNIDAIRAASTRNDAIEILEDAIREILTRLTVGTEDIQVKK